MTKNDIFQMNRAKEAHNWLKDPMREIERLGDIQKRKQLDITIGHLPQCGILKCHKDCKHKGYK